MDPQFIINVGGLDKLKFTEDEFLELLGIDFDKAIQAKSSAQCPECMRSKEDCYFIYKKYKDYKIGVKYKLFEESEVEYGGKGSYLISGTEFHLCVCGCLYFSKFKIGHQNMNIAWGI